MPDFEARARKVLPSVLGHYTWLSIERGEGSWLVTTDGRRVLDMTCGIAVTVVGHSHPRVVKAVVDQAQRLMHISAGVAKYESSVALAEQLATITPQGLDTVFFGNSGAEAVEGAIKLSRQTTGREAIIVFRGGFHGRTVGAATLTTSKAQYPRCTSLRIRTRWRARCRKRTTRRPAQPTASPSSRPCWSTRSRPSTSRRS